MKKYSLEELEKMDTIKEGQFDDLKVETEDTKVLLSRMTVSDGMPYDNQVTVYKKKKNSWKEVAVYQAI